jgi:hypothetical protein
VDSLIIHTRYGPYNSRTVKNIINEINALFLRCSDAQINNRLCKSILWTEYFFSSLLVISTLFFQFCKIEPPVVTINVSTILTSNLGQSGVGLMAHYSPIAKEQSIPDFLSDRVIKMGSWMLFHIG